MVLKDREAPEGSPTPVDLDLEKVLGDMPNKTFKCVLGVGFRRMLRTGSAQAGQQ